MAFAPIAFVIPEYDRNLYKNWWLKAYEPGTTTSKVMATDQTGSTTASRYELNSQGFPVTAGDAFVVPHIDGDYDLWLFPTAAEADANDTTNALQFADNLGIESLISNTLTISSGNLTFSSIADVKSGTLNTGKTINYSNISDGVKITWMGYYSQSDGGSNWGTLKKGSPPTADDGLSIFVIDVNNYVQANTRGRSLSVLKAGAIGDGVADDLAPILTTISFAETVTFGNVLDFYLSDQIEFTEKRTLRIGESTLIGDFAGNNPNTKAIIRNVTNPIKVFGGYFRAASTDHTDVYEYSPATGWRVNEGIASPTEVVNVPVREFLLGIFAAHGSTIKGCDFENLYSAGRITKFSGAPSATDLPSRILNCDARLCGGGSAGVRPNFSIQNCGNAFFKGNTTYFGSESTFPSCKYLLIANNIMKNPTTPTIDVGGSSAAGFEAEDITIVNNTVWGRDPIVIEGGVWGALIDGNNCVVTNTFPSGIGVGVTDQFASGQGVKNVTIGDTTVRLYDENNIVGRMTRAVSVSSEGLNPVTDITISGVNATSNSVREGIFVRGDDKTTSKTLRVSDVSIPNCYRPYTIWDMGDAVVAGGSLRTDSYQGVASYAMLSIDSDVKFDRPDIKGTDKSTFGWEYILYVNGDASGVSMYLDDLEVNSRADVIGYDAGASNFPLFRIDNFFTTTGGSFSNCRRGSSHRWREGSVYVAGGYVEQVCITGGATPVFRAANQIQP